MGDAKVESRIPRRRQLLMYVSLSRGHVLFLLPLDIYGTLHDACSKGEQGFKRL